MPGEVRKVPLGLRETCASSSITFLHANSLVLAGSILRTNSLVLVGSMLG